MKCILGRAYNEKPVTDFKIFTLSFLKRCVYLKILRRRKREEAGHKYSIHWSLLQRSALGWPKPAADSRVSPVNVRDLGTPSAALSCLSTRSWLRSEAELAFIWAPGVTNNGFVCSATMPALNLLPNSILLLLRVKY